MQRQHLVFLVTLAELTSRIRHYIETFPPQGFLELRFVRQDLFIWDEPTKDLSFTLYGVRSEGARVPLLEFYGIEMDGLCSASFGCDQPGDPRWLREMLARFRLVWSTFREEGWPEWLSPSSAELEAPLELRAGENPVSALDRDEAEVASAEKSQPAAPAPRPTRPAKAGSGGRRAGKKNTPVEEQERYCEEYLRLHLKNGMKLQTYVWERHLPFSTFCDWLKHYKERHPDWEAKARAS